jgi:hypothetical protein
MFGNAPTDECFGLDCAPRRSLGTRMQALLFSLLLVPGVASLAAAASDCNSLTDRGERLKCKFDALADEGKKTIEYLQQPPFSDIATPSQMAGLGRYKDQLDRAKGRLQAADFRSIARKKDARCQLVEKEGDGDGICDPEKGEVCAEALGDGIGDEDGVCFPMHGKKREVCAQLCDDEAIAQTSENGDDNLSTELEGIYDDMTAHAQEVNGALPEVATLLAAQTLESEEPQACPLDTGGATRTNFIVYLLAKTAAVTSRGGADIAERLCDQQVMMNCAACCAPAEVIAGSFAAAWTAIEIVESTVNSATLDAALTCVAGLKASADSNNAVLDEIRKGLAELEAAQNETLRLLATPQGRRTPPTGTTAAPGRRAGTASKIRQGASGGSSNGPGQ